MVKNDDKNYMIKNLYDKTGEYKHKERAKEVFWHIGLELCLVYMSINNFDKYLQINLIIDDQPYT